MHHRPASASLVGCTAAGTPPRVETDHYRYHYMYTRSNLISTTRPAGTSRDEIALIRDAVLVQTETCCVTARSSRSLTASLHSPPYLCGRSELRSPVSYERR